VKIGRRSFVQAEELDQHVLQAVSNVILEVSACRNNVSDQAEAIASKLADRVQSGWSHHRRGKPCQRGLADPQSALVRRGELPCCSNQDEIVPGHSEQSVGVAELRLTFEPSNVVYFEAAFSSARAWSIWPYA
jgi:hypothetical protein